MDEGLDPPCLELGEGPEHELLYWMSTHVNVRGIIRDFDDSKKVYVVMHLLDGGFIEKLTFEDSYRFKLLIRCPGEDSCRTSTLGTGAAGPKSLLLPRSGGSERKDEVCLGSRSEPRHSEVNDESSLFVATNREWHPSAPRPVRRKKPLSPESHLAIEVFPSAIGDRFPRDQGALARNLRSWPERYGLDFPFIERMMREFGQHHQWYRTAKAPAWKCFLARREELVHLVRSQQKKDPASRRWRPDGELRGRDFWLGRHTPRATSPA